MNMHMQQPKQIGNATTDHEGHYTKITTQKAFITAMEVRSTAG